MHLLLVDVSPLVIISVADGCEGFLAVVALVGLLACVDPHMDPKVGALIERLLTPHALEARVLKVSEVPHDFGPPCRPPCTTLVLLVVNLRDLIKVAQNVSLLPLGSSLLGALHR